LKKQSKQEIKVINIVLDNYWHSMWHSDGYIQTCECVN
jgi:hypothetical protein